MESAITISNQQQEVKDEHINIHLQKFKLCSFTFDLEKIKSVEDQPIKTNHMNSINTIQNYKYSL